LRPVGIALIDLVQGDADSDVPVVAASAAESIRETIRDADTACRLDDGTFAIILEDTPENGAVWTVERVRRNLVGRFGNHIMWAGVACYPAHAFTAEDLLAQSRAALLAAKEWKQDRIEVALSE
jgi:diguanylate cyclase (GGDEF)-like protein